MSEHFFGLHAGHLSKRADDIAGKHGAWHVNYTDPGTGERRGWFATHNRGNPFDRDTANAVMSAIDAVGGIDALRLKR